MNSTYTRYIKDIFKDYIIFIAIIANFYVIGYLNYYLLNLTSLENIIIKRLIHILLGMVLIFKHRQLSYIFKISPYINWLGYLLITSLIIHRLYAYLSLTQWPILRIDHVFVFLNTLADLNLVYCTLCISSLFPVFSIIYIFFNRDNLSRKTHGSAQLMNTAELEKINEIKGIPIGLMTRINANQPFHDQMTVIAKPCYGQLIRLNPDHILVVAPSGSGKGVSIVIPTLLDYEGSVVVTDVKAAENYHVTAEQRRRMGHIVYAFDPYQLTDTKSCSINILDSLDPLSEHFIEHVNELVSILCPLPIHDTGNARFFVEQASSLIQCFVLYVTAHSDINPNDRNLLQVYKFLCLPPDELNRFLIRLSQEDFCNNIPGRLAANLLSPGKEELGSTLSTARTALRFIDTPIMHRLTASTTLDVESLINNRADLFICIPTEALDSQKRMIQLLLSAVFLHMRKKRIKPIPSLLFLIDEMPFLGHIKQLEQILLIGRGYGIRIMAIAQTIDSLKQVYPQSWQTILASNLSLFFGISDVHTAEYVAKMLGKQTIEVESTNKSQNQGRGNRSTGKGTTSNTTARPLLTPEETMRLPQHLLLGFIRAHKPMLLEKICYHTAKQWKNKFNDNPLETRF